MLCAAGVDFIELNISCPNVKQGGLAFGIRAQDASEVVSAVRKVCTVPLIVKLSPQAESIPEMCKAVEAAGADAISLCNTFQACAIDLEKRRPVFNNTFAGLSGPAVRPIALRMVWQAVGAVSIPVVGLGGILTGRDALEFIMAGATAVQVAPRISWTRRPAPASPPKSVHGWMPRRQNAGRRGSRRWMKDPRSRPFTRYPLSSAVSRHFSTVTKISIHISCSFMRNMLRLNE